MGQGDRRARLAAGNNADLYIAVFAAHGLEFRQDRSAFVSHASPPPWYGSMTTLDPDETAMQYRAIDALLADGRKGFGVKDGFCRLRLASRGFRVLFDATWVWGTPRQGRPARGWERVGSAAALAEWERGWADAGSPADRQVFPPALLADPSLAFFGRRAGAGFDAGCLVNRSEYCVGISNVFVPEGNAGAVAIATGLAAGLAPGLPVTGYARGELLEAMQDCGFEAVGSLRVWIAGP